MIKLFEWHPEEKEFTIVDWNRANKKPGHFSLAVDRYNQGDIGLPEHFSFYVRPGSGVDFLLILDFYYFRVTLAMGYWISPPSVSSDFAPCPACNECNFNTGRWVRTCMDPFHDEWWREREAREAVKAAAQITKQED